MLEAHCLTAGEASSTELPAVPSGLKCKQIAAQCCTSGGACRRRSTPSGLYSSSDDDCIAGAGRVGNECAIRPSAFGQAAAKCASLGLSLCLQPCTGFGCDYKYPVYTALPCTGTPCAASQAYGVDAHGHALCV